MLDSIRKRKDNLVYTLLILAVVAVMGFYGIGQFGGDDRAGQTGPVAYVNGEPITQQEFRNELGMRMQQYQQMLGGQFDEKFLSALKIPERTLEELVQYKLLAQQAQKLGVRVPDKELADYIRSIPYFQKDGKFDAESYAKLPQKGAEEKRMRERLQVSRFQNYLANRVRLTPADVQWAHQLRDTKVDVEYAKIDFNALAGQQKPSQADVDKVIKETPETELKSYYDSHVKDFSTPASVMLRQIRVGVPFKASEEHRANAKKKIEAIAAEVTPQNFAEKAKAKSDDEYAKKGGLVGWINRGTLEDPLEKAIDTLEVGKVSAPVDTPYGFFLLKIDERKDAVTQPFEIVKGKIAEKLAAEKSKKAVAENMQKKWEETLASGKSIEADLKKAKIDIKKTGPFSAGHGVIPQIGQADPLLEGIFELTKEKPVSKKLHYHQDHYYYLKLVSVEYPKAGSLEKDREMIEKSSSSALQAELLNQWVNALQKQATIKTELKMGEAEPETMTN